LPTNNLAFMAGYTDNRHADVQCAFASVGTTLTDAEVSALHTLVTTYQTSLSRNN